MFITMSGTGCDAPGKKLSAEQEAILEFAAGLYAEDYRGEQTSEPVRVDGQHGISVDVKFSNNRHATAEMFVRSMENSTAIIELLKTEILSIGTKEKYREYASWFFEKKEGSWERTGRMRGQVVKTVDLDGDGVDELILRTDSRYMETKREHGAYNMAFRDLNGAYQTVSQPGLGAFQRDDFEKKDWKRNVHLDYIETDKGMLIKSQISGSEVDPVSLLIRWNGKDLTARPEGQEELTVRGQDIWVRDEAVTGEVIMKLNEGDRCRVLERDHFEIIRGRPDFWYRIEFEGGEGWVFGSQTSLAFYSEPINSADAVWYAFKNAELNQCEQKAALNYLTLYQYEGCRYELPDDRTIRLIEETEDPCTNVVTRYSAVGNALLLIRDHQTCGGASLSRREFTKTAYQSNSGWTMRTGDILSGQPDTFLVRSGNQIVLFTLNKYDIGPMVRERSLNVTLFNQGDNAPFRQLQEIGPFDVGMEVEQSAEEGEMLTESVSFDYEFDNSPVSLVLTEYKKKKQGNGTLSVPELTEKSVYTWNEGQMKFVRL